MSYEEQRKIFAEARQAGWPGKEPSVLGTFDADEALQDAQGFLASNDRIADALGRKE